MKTIQFILACILLFCNSAESGAKKVTDEIKRYLQDVNDSSVQKRTLALSKINYLLENNKIQMSDDIKNKTYILIKEMQEGVYKYDPRQDDEELYPWELEKLAVKINNNTVLPFLLSRINSSQVVDALSLRGEDILIEIFPLLDAYSERNDVRIKAVIEVLTRLVDKNGKTYINKMKTRNEIKDKVMQIIIKTNESMTASENKNTSRQEYIAKNIILPSLKLFLTLGDKDVIPFIENIGKGDAYYEMVPKGEGKYRGMTPHERHGYMPEIREKREKIKREITAGGMGNEKEPYYPVKEAAEKVVEQLKKK